MTALETRAEIIKLARVLRRDADELQFLRAVPAADIRHLRETTHNHLFEGDRATFRKLAAASKLLPTRITAVITQNAFAPAFVARIAGEMQVARAIDIAQRLDTTFLADVTLELDPRRVEPIIRDIPVKVIRAIALELTRREEFITMGLFVGYLSDDAITQVLAAITDEEHLLRIGLFIEARETIPTLVGKLSDERLRRMVALSIDDGGDLWGPGLSLMAYLDPPAQRKLGDWVAESDDATLTRLMQRSDAEDLWPSILPLISRMSYERQARLLRLDALADPEVLRRIFTAAQEHDQLRTLLPIVATATADPDRVVALYRAAAEAGLVPHLLGVADQLDERERGELATVAAAVPDELQDRFAADIDRAGLWPQMFDVAATIPPADRAGLAGAVRRIATARPELVDELAGLAQDRGLDDLVAEARAAG